MMMNEWESQIYLHPPDKMNDLYYKVCCYWNAKTEMYDYMTQHIFQVLNFVAILPNIPFMTKHSRLIYYLLLNLILYYGNKITGGLQYG